MERKTPDWAKNLALLTVIVSELVGFTGVGVGLGYWAWSRWGAPWWVILVTSMGGLALAMYRVYSYSQKIGQDESD